MPQSQLHPAGVDQVHSQPNSFPGRLFNLYRDGCGGPAPEHNRPGRKRSASLKPYAVQSGCDPTLRCRAFQPVRESAWQALFRHRQACPSGRIAPPQDTLINGAEGRAFTASARVVAVTCSPSRRLVLQKSNAAAQRRARRVRLGAPSMPRSGEAQVPDIRPSLLDTRDRHLWRREDED